LKQNESKERILFVIIVRKECKNKCETENEIKTWKWRQ